MRGVVHFAAALAVAALAFAFGRWLRDPSPGAPLLILLGAGLLFAVAARRLYGPGGPGRAPEVALADPVADAEPEPPDDRIDLNAASAADLQRVPGIGRLRCRENVEGGWVGEGFGRGLGQPSVAQFRAAVLPRGRHATSGQDSCRRGGPNPLPTQPPLTFANRYRDGSSDSFPLVRRACISSCARRASLKP